MPHVPDVDAGGGPSRVAIVVIGRNEGPRLARSLEAAVRESVPVVYVDSGSSDGSVALARRLGVAAVELDPRTAFTAARGRNEGLAAVLAAHPDTELVQFVDGDCELVVGWLEQGARTLSTDPRLAATFGRVRERNREASVYNLLCDLEWRGPPGEARSCGGNAMMRVEAVRQVNGFDGTLIAGEEPELSLRLRRAGWRLFRCDRDMVLHDAAMTRFGQWWRRAVRAGWAYAEGAWLHGASPERHFVRESASILFWGVIVPGLALGAAWPTGGASVLVAALGYAVLGVRIGTRAIRRGLSMREASLLAAFTVLAKFPQAIGQLQFAALRVRGRGRRLVDWRAAG